MCSVCTGTQRNTDAKNEMKSIIGYVVNLSDGMSGSMQWLCTASRQARISV
jgi:hypothetical protein